MPLVIQIEKDPDCDKFLLKGPLDESSTNSLMKIMHHGGKKVVFNFSHLEYINSIGARNWMNFLRSFAESIPNRKIIFEECAFDVISQINMFPAFRGDAEIRSFRFEFYCESCNSECSRIFETNENYQELIATIEASRCFECNKVLEPDEPIESILSFLK